MADNDIYDNKSKYEVFQNNLVQYLQVPSGKRKYQIKCPTNIKYFNKLMTRFEITDISYIRRLRLLRSFLIVCHAIEQDLATVDRDEIDQMVVFAHQRNRNPKTKRDFITDLKYMWKVILPDRDERGRIDDSLVPYVVRHLSNKIDKSREKMRTDRFSMDEFEQLVGAFADDTRMQALLTLMLESLGRPQEILGRNLKDVELHDNYAKVYISEHGKEGIGFLRCIDSFFYLAKWLNEHPLKGNLQAPLFVCRGNKAKFERLKPPSANYLLRERCRALGIEKPITLYSLKRNGVTQCRLRGDSDVDIQHRARWTSTKQLQTYDMSNQEDTFKAELIQRGLFKAETKNDVHKPRLKECLFCKAKNGIAETVCINCKRMLDRGFIEEEEKKREEERRKLGDEVERIKTQLDQAHSRDELILRILNGLSKKRKINELVKVLKEENLACELAQMK